MDIKKIVSYASNILVFAATAFLVLRVLSLDTTGLGITNEEFIPLRNAMFLIGVPCLVKFYVSCDDNFRENKFWLAGYFICLACWIAFIGYTLMNVYFKNIRTMCIASFVLMCVATYLEYSVIRKDKE